MYNTLTHLAHAYFFFHSFLSFSFYAYDIMAQLGFPVFLIFDL